MRLFVLVLRRGVCSAQAAFESSLSSVFAAERESYAAAEARRAAEEERLRTAYGRVVSDEEAREVSGARRVG
jgi:outer membrane receptor for Fe3+-dicitrate